MKDASVSAARFLPKEDVDGVVAGEKAEVKPLSVSQFIGMVNERLRSIDVSMAGEVSRVSFPPSGHVYFSLKDENADSVIDCVIWKSQSASGGLVDDRPDRAGFQSSGHTLSLRPRAMRPLLAMLCGRERRAGEGEAVHHQDAGADRGGGAALQGDDDAAAVLLQELQVLRQVVARHHVEHDIDAARQLLHFGRPVVVLVDPPRGRRRASSPRRPSPRRAPS